MKLVKQTKLHFKEGNSNKVYEADICEVGTEQYVVNFRYGKFGAPLIEGSKTASPVDMSKAQDIFDKLIKEKVAKGYQDITAGGVAADPLVFVATGEKEADRKSAVLWHLSLGVSNPPKQREKRWNIKRAIWRAGELQLPEAVEHLVKLFGKGLQNEKNIYEYCILWALGKCGEKADEATKNIAIDCLQQHRNHDWQPCANIAKSSLMLLLPEGSAGRANLLQEITQKLPPIVQEKLEQPQALSALLQTYINERQKQVHAVSFIYDLYIIGLSRPALKGVVCRALELMPLRANFFKHIRAIYKSALQQNDARTVGIIASLSEGAMQLFDSGRYNAYVNGTYIKNVKEELKKADSRAANSIATNKKFRAAAKKYYESVENQNDAATYLQFATAYLLQVDDSKDAHQGKNSQTTKWHYDYKKRQYTTTVTHYPAFLSRPIFNLITQKANDNIVFNKKGGIKYKADFDPTKDEKEKSGLFRREAHQDWWDAQPQAALHLMVDCKSEAVAKFANRILKKSTQLGDLLAKADVDFFVKMMQSGIETKSKFAVEQFKQRFNVAELTAAQMQTLLASSFAPAKEIALAAMRADPSRYFADVQLIYNFAIHSDNTLRTWVQDNWEAIFASWDADRCKLYTGLCVGFLAKANHRADQSVLQSMLHRLRTSLREYSAQLGMEVLTDLLRSSRTDVATFAAEVLSFHQRGSERLDDEILLTLILHREQGVRTYAEAILQSFGSAAVVARKDFFLNLLQTGNEIFRKLARAKLLAAAATMGAEFVGDLLSDFVQLLQRKEKVEGLHKVVYDILLGEFDQELSKIHRDVIFRLLNCEHRLAQELSANLLRRFVDMKEFAVRNIVRLAGHEALTVRQLAWNTFNNQVERMRYESEDALRLLDSDWEDTRSFAREYFRKNYREEEWAPTLLVSLCDSVREDVQAFGTEMLTKFFKGEHGTEYLWQLSQHPRPRLQLYATNYLQAYAADRADIIQRLEQYFLAVLSQVNKGRLAKDRIFAFLHAEALKNESIALFVAGLIGRISATQLIQDKARCIEILRDIRLRFADIELVCEIETA